LPVQVCGVTNLDKQQEGRTPTGHYAGQAIRHGIPTNAKYENNAEVLEDHMN
jgi:hypothetical protein